MRFVMTVLLLKHFINEAWWLTFLEFARDDSEKLAPYFVGALRMMLQSENGDVQLECVYEDRAPHWQAKLDHAGAQGEKRPAAS
jgi:hypothetical protein